MSKSIDVRRREETKQINLCFLHMVVAVPTIFAEPLVWVEEVVKWREGMFHDERSFHKYG